MPDSGGNSCQRDSQGRRLTEKLDAPLIDDLTLLNHDFRRDLVESALSARVYRKLDANEVQRTTLDACHGHHITGACLAELLSRNADSLRKQHLKQLVQTGHLQLAFPPTPTHQMQAYRTTESE